MSKIYEYLGILIYFYSNEHDPVHVHANYSGLESKAEFIIVDGKVTEIKIKAVKGSAPLTGAKLNDFEKFLEHYADQIVQKWVDYFVYHKQIKFEKINTRLK
jgi:hypothetical protein